jgi:hypothetical protein
VEIDITAGVTDGVVAWKNLSMCGQELALWRRLLQCLSPESVSNSAKLLV